MKTVQVHLIIWTTLVEFPTKTKKKGPTWKGCFNLRGLVEFPTKTIQTWSSKISYYNHSKKGKI